MNQQEPFGVYNPVTGEQMEICEPRPVTADDMRQEHCHGIEALKAAHILAEYSLKHPTRYRVMVCYLWEPRRTQQSVADEVGVTKQMVCEHIKRILQDFPTLEPLIRG